MTPRRQTRNPGLLAAALLCVLSPCGFALPPAAEAAPVAPVRVFVLAGQSNMVGQAVVDLDHPDHYNGGKGTLVHVMANTADPQRYAHLRTDKGEWVVRKDVFVRFRTAEGVKAGELDLGFTEYGGKHHFGPEMQIGHRLGDALAEPVLLIKTAWGGKSLDRDFRPPSAGGPTGEFYTRMLTEVREALDALETDFPALKGRQAKLSGFIWFQGWNDMVDAEARKHYRSNLVHLIEDVRAAWADPNLPVVIGELGNGGPDADDSLRAIRIAQAEAAADPALAGTPVRFVETAAFARPAQESPNVTHGHHWFGNAESYFLIGDALGSAMAELATPK